VAIGIISAAAMVLGKKMGRVQTIILFSYLSYSFYTAIILGAGNEKRKIFFFFFF
jgi:hypothetical protein